VVNAGGVAYIHTYIQRVNIGSSWRSGNSGDGRVSY
jgi:hypothetical protein